MLVTLCGYKNAEFILQIYAGINMHHHEKICLGLLLVIIMQESTNRTSLLANSHLHAHLHNHYCPSTAGSITILDTFSSIHWMFYYCIWMHSLSNAQLFIVLDTFSKQLRWCFHFSLVFAINWLPLILCCSDSKREWINWWMWWTARIHGLVLSALKNIMAGTATQYYKVKVVAAPNPWKDQLFQSNVMQTFAVSGSQCCSRELQLTTATIGPRLEI